MAINFSNVTAITLGVEDVLQIQDSLGTVLWQKAQPVTANYFYVEDISGNNNTLSIIRESGNVPIIEPYYSTDQQTWTSMGTTSTSTPVTATIPANGKLYIKCTADKWCYNSANTSSYANKISCTGNFNVGGNIMSLLNGDNFENTTFTSSNNSAFRGMFASTTNLISAGNLVLPNNAINDEYEKMFKFCTGLTTAPALPATTVGGWCYVEMFQGCTALTTIPALSMTSAGSTACTNMFAGCSSLTETPVLYVTNVTSSRVFENLFYGCTSLNKVYTYADSITNSSVLNWLYNVAPTGDFYALGSANWTIDSPSGVPVGWTLHHSLPVSCNVSISSNGNGSVSVNGVSGDYSDTVMSDTVLTLAATADNGYYFTGWSDGNTSASRTITVTGDLTLTASFAQVVNYNVSVSAGSNGTVSVNGVTGNYSQSVVAGTTLTLAATADSGYMFDEWSDGDTNASRTITVIGNVTLTASFVIQHQLNNEIWYETNNNQTANFSNAGFNGTQTSNTYSNNKGVATYSGNITSASGNSGTSTATNLTKISFPDTLTSIGQHTFDGCPLTELDFNNVTSVGYEAFDDNHIQHLHIPATLTTITNNPFRSSTITQITVDSNNPNYNDGSTHNGSNCIYQGTTLISGCVNTVIPDNCTIIGDWSMSYNSSLTTLNLPASVTQLKQYAADSNPNLRTVYARSNPSFGNGVFANGVPTGGTLYYTSNVNYQNWLNRLPSGWTAVLLCNTTISAGNNGSVSVNGVSGNYHQSELPSGTQLTLVATPAAGYQFDSWSDGDTNATRTVTITADTTLTASFVQAGEYFYVEDASGSNNTLTIEKNFADAPTIEVFKSTDGTNWTSMGNTSTSGITATVPANGKLYLKAVTDRWRNPSSPYYNHKIGCNANFKIGGHITSLLFGDNYAIFPLNSTTNTNAFEKLFGYNNYLLDASDLVLPDTTAPYCYFAMLEGDENLIGAPVLPATTLAEYCYGRMFLDCQSLDEIVCYADTLGSNSTFKWLAGVSSTGDFYKLGSAVYSSDENGIPTNWTVHTSL